LEKSAIMALKITSSRTQNSPYLKLCVYGLSGVGKTVLGSTAPKPIVLSAEKGLLSISSKDIPVIEIQDLSEVKEAIMLLRKEKVVFSTLVLDSLSELGEVYISKILPSYKDPRQAYGVLADQMLLTTRYLRDLPKHIVVICKQEVYKDEMSGSTYYRPASPGQAFTQQIPHLFDEVLCLRMGKKDKKVYRYLQTQPDPQYTAKDRSGKLSIEEPPDLSYIFEKILNSKGDSTPETKKPIEIKKEITS
jgi:hypothetical protein